MLKITTQNKMATRSRRRKKKSVVTSSDYIHDFSCIPCADEGKNTEAQHQCVDCKQYYCKRCLDIHRQLTKNHIIIAAGDTYTKQDEGRAENNIEYEEKEFCEYHDGKEINMYCYRHDTVCCDTCVSQKHRFCRRVKSIEICSRKGLDMGEDVTQDLEEIATDLRDLKSKQQAFYANVELKRNKITTKIQQFKAELIKKAEDLEKASLKEVERRTDSIMMDLNHDIERVSNMLQETETYLNNTKQQNGNEAKMFVNLKLAKRRMSERKDHRTELFGKTMESINFKIHPEMEKYFKDYESFGNFSVFRGTLAPFVNIVIPVESSASHELKKRLHCDLRRTGIHSKYIGVSDIVADIHTVVVISCMNDLRDLQVERQQHEYIILLRLDETPLVERSWLEKLNDYMTVPLADQFVNFVKWADVALKTSISFQFSMYPRRSSFVFDESDVGSAMAKIAGITHKKIQLMTSD